MSKTIMLALAALASASAAAAQPALPQVQIQQIPPAPAPPRSVPDIRIEPPAPAAADAVGGARIRVDTLHVTGATRFSEAQLVTVAGFRPASELDLGELRGMAARITEFYRQHGYFLAQAYLPAQAIENGVVTIAVIEGRYGTVALDVEAPVSPALARGVMQGLAPGDLVEIAPLERRLLLLSDLPGVVVASSLAAGAAVGTSDLRVRLTPGRRITGSLEADNGGSRYTGPYRIGGSVSFNEPTGHGDVITLRALTSGSGLTYLRGAYEARLGAATLGVAYTHFDYELGREFEALDAHGQVGIASLYASYPLIRSRNANLYGLAAFDHKTFRDEVGATGATTEKTARVALLGLAGDRHDRLWGGGWSTFSLNAYAGDLDLRTPLARADDALTARTQGRYGKLTLEADRLQAFDGPLSLYLRGRGQLASKNLDASEKMELGGAYGVRAYPEGEGYGDEGYLLTAEARLRLARLSEQMGGTLQAVAFVDHGAVTLSKSPWAAGDNHRALSAVGVGLTWADRHDLVVKVSYAVKLGDEAALSAPDRSGRVWVQVSKLF